MLGEIFHDISQTYITTVNWSEFHHGTLVLFLRHLAAPGASETLELKAMDQLLGGPSRPVFASAQSERPSQNYRDKFRRPARKERGKYAKGCRLELAFAIIGCAMTCCSVNPLVGCSAAVRI
jgi:hypothetical protein